MPLLKLEDSGDSAVVCLWKIEEDENYFHRHLPRDFLAGFDAKRFNEKRRTEFLAARFALLKTLGAEAMTLTLDENGKPVDALGMRHVSVSHSGNLAAAITSRFPAGIDIEMCHPRVRKVMRKFLNEKERLLLGDEPELWQLTLCWSAKESLYKMLGQPGLAFAENITLKIPNAKQGSFEADITTSVMAKTISIRFEAGEDYALTFCVDKPVHC